MESDPQQKLTNEYLQQIARDVRSIQGWIVFIGIMFILSLVGSFLAWIM